MDEQSTVCVTALGRERPGVIAAVTGVLYDADCDIRDSMMTVLGGECVIVMLVILPAPMNVPSLERALSDVQRRFELSCYVRPLSYAEAHLGPGPGLSRFAITLYGGDRKGMLHLLAALLARKGITITELKTKIIGGYEGAGVISLKVAAPPELSAAEVREQVASVAGRFGVEFSVA